MFAVLALVAFWISLLILVRVCKLIAAGWRRVPRAARHVITWSPVALVALGGIVCTLGASVMVATGGAPHTGGMFAFVLTEGLCAGLSLLLWSAILRLAVQGAAGHEV